MSIAFADFFVLFNSRRVDRTEHGYLAFAVDDFGRGKAYIEVFHLILKAAFVVLVILFLYALLQEIQVAVHLLQVQFLSVQFLRERIYFHSERSTGRVDFRNPLVELLFVVFYLRNRGVY